MLSTHLDIYLYLNLIFIAQCTVSFSFTNIKLSTMLLLLRFSTLIKFFPLFFNSLLNLSSNSSGLTCFLALQRYDQTDNQNNILLRVGFSPSSEYFNSFYCDIIRFSDVFFFLFLFLLVRVHSRCRIPFSFPSCLCFFSAPNLKKCLISLPKDMPVSLSPLRPVSDFATTLTKK